MHHLHLDLVGGLAGDMFIAALLDCAPDAAADLAAVIHQAGFADLVHLELKHHNDGVLSGKQFKVRPTATEENRSQAATHDHEHEHRHSHEHEHSHSHEHSHEHDHGHRHYQEIREIIQQSELAAPVQDIALKIFHIIAEAEAAIHDKSIAEVAFHEVGAWDSIADVLCASYLIHKLNISSASCSALPLGRGQVKTAHGMLPVPAPATALILKGFEFVDDGVSGERVTPTGAAILKYLNPGQRPPATLLEQGFGFGTKKLPGISNTVRALLLETSTAGQSDEWQSESIHQLEFEIDDQTPEQLASALDHLRQQASVLDIVQYSAYGKKNRLSHGIRILATSDITPLLAECFRQTSTLGIRHSRVQRHILRREQVSVEHGGRSYGVKVAQRPGGETAKVEMDELKPSGSMSELAELRQAIETSALSSHQSPTK